MNLQDSRIPNTNELARAENQTRYMVVYDIPRLEEKKVSLENQYQRQRSAYDGLKAEFDKHTQARMAQLSTLKELEDLLAAHDGVKPAFRNTQNPVELSS